MAIITAAQFRQHYPQQQGSADDTVIDQIIAEADALMALYCEFPSPDSGGRTLTSATYTLYPAEPDIEQPRRLQLGIRPVTAVVAYVDLDELYATAIPSAELVLDVQTGAIWLTPTAAHAWACNVGRANKVVATAGYTSTPNDLVAIAAAAVRHRLDLRRSQGTANAPPDASTPLPEAVRDALGPYVLWGNRVG